MKRIVTGSGPQDRDESLLGHKPFLVVADYLTRRGIAVLRVDDRGVGRSTGNFEKSTSVDFATDVEAGMAYLKTRPEINAKMIGLIGHSEGGLIAPMVASRNSDVAWVVLMAGSAMTGEQILFAHQKMIAHAMGVSEEQIAKSHVLHRDLYQIVRTANDGDELKANMKEARIKERLSQAGSMPEARIEGLVNFVSLPWFRYSLDYDPVPALMKTKVPVLAINGELDLQVPKENLELIRKALTAGGNRDFQVLELPKLNHLFQTANTGAPSEYATIEETISPTALDAMVTWIKKHTM